MIQKTLNDRRCTIANTCYPCGISVAIHPRWKNLNIQKIYRTGWDPKQPVSTPRGLKNPKQAVELLVKAAKKVQEKYGRLDVPWGEVNRFGPEDKDYPANGGSEQYGIYRTIYFTPDRQKPARNRATSGDTYVAIAEFGVKVRAKVSLSYGNATQPGHKHNGDQWEDMSAKRLRPALLERKDILRNLEKREKITFDRAVLER